MCQPGRPLPHGESHAGSPGFAAFQSAKSIGLRFASSTSTRAAGRLPQLLDRAVRELAVAVEALDVEVDALILDHVRVPARDELRHEVDHAVDVLGGVRPVIGSLHVEAVHEIEVDGFELRGELGLGDPLLRGAGDDLVLDVGHVAHEGDVEARPLEVATDDVEHDRGACVADVRLVVDRRPAHVERHLARLARDELDRVAHQRVADPHHAR